MECDRGDSFIFDFQPNRIPFCSKNSDKNCHHDHIPFNSERNGNPLVRVLGWPRPRWNSKPGLPIIPPSPRGGRGGCQLMATCENKSSWHHATVYSNRCRQPTNYKTPSTQLSQLNWLSTMLAASSCNGRVAQCLVALIIIILIILKINNYT